MNKLLVSRPWPVFREVHGRVCYATLTVLVRNLEGDGLGHKPFAARCEKQWSQTRRVSKFFPVAPSGATQTQNHWFIVDFNGGYGCYPLLLRACKQGVSRKFFGREFVFESYLFRNKEGKLREGLVRRITTKIIPSTALLNTLLCKVQLFSNSVGSTGLRVSWTSPTCVQCHLGRKATRLSCSVQICVPTCKVPHLDNIHVACTFQTTGPPGDRKHKELE